MKLHALLLTLQWLVLLMIVHHRAPECFVLLLVTVRYQWTIEHSRILTALDISSY
jgi:hypothetical protein